MQTDSTSTHKLLGVWSGNAYPLQETTIAFCPDGKGLLFYFVGSGGGGIDEFEYEAVDDKTIRVTWTSVWERPNPEDDDGEPEDPLEPDEDDLRVGLVEEVDYTIQRGRLKIAMGRDAYVGPDSLGYVGKAAPFAEQREFMQKYDEEFDPFHGGTPVWSVGDGNWEMTGVIRGEPVRLDDIDPAPIEMPAIELSLLLFASAGMIGPFVRLLQQTRYEVMLWIGILPFLIFLIYRERYSPPFPWHLRCVRARRFGAALYVLLTVSGWILLATGLVRGPGSRGPDFEFFAFIGGLGALGLIPMLRELRGRAQPRVGHFGIF